MPLRLGEYPVRCAVLMAVLAAGLFPGPACIAGQKPRTHTVTIDAMKFQPETLTVKTGDRVVWVNKDMFPHTVTGKSGGLDSGTMTAGASWSSTIAPKGELAYFCAFHPSMTGRLVAR